MLAIAFAHPPKFAPGTAYEYSNTNYALLGLVVEKVDRRSLATAMQKRLFGPLGMKNTMLPRQHLERHPRAVRARLSVRQLVRHHDRHPEPGLHREVPEPRSRPARSSPKTTPRVNHSFATAAGGVISTADDLATWIRALVGGPVLNAQYQRSGATALPSRPRRPGLRVRYQPSSAGGPTPSTSTAVRPSATTPRRAYDPTNKLTLVLWTNLTVSPTDKLTANRLMLNVLDRIYKLSPLAPGAVTTQSG